MTYKLRAANGITKLSVNELCYTKVEFQKVGDRGSHLSQFFFTHKLSGTSNKERGFQRSKI